MVLLHDRLHASCWREMANNRNLLKLKIERQEEVPSNVWETKRVHLQEVDENRNSLVIEGATQLSPTELCEVVTTEITERKTTKKKVSPVKQFRNLVRATIVTSDTASEHERTTKNTSRRKKLAATLVRKKPSQENRISNEGACLWNPIENCCWRSKSDRIVQLSDVHINQLTEPERNKLKELALERLRQYNFHSPIIAPKEFQNTARNRWKQILVLRKKETNVKVHPVFSVDLYQVIENDKIIEKSQHDAEIDVKNDNLKSVLESNSLEGLDKQEDRYRETTREPIRTIETLEEVDEDNWASTKRKSRLIDALALSSTSASSLCILDCEEFKRLPVQVPRVVRETTEFIQTHALNTVGIFRNGGSKKRVTQMKEDYDNGREEVVTDESNPNDVGALLKEFLRCLPEPLLTRELYNVFLQAAKDNEDVMEEIVSLLVWLLPAVNRDTLECVLDCLNNVARNSEDSLDSKGDVVSGNKMHSMNLATLITPNILHRSKVYKSAGAYQVDEALHPEDNKASIAVVNHMINSNKTLFTIPADTHHEILKTLLDEEPEIVDYVLRKSPDSNLGSPEVFTLPSPTLSSSNRSCSTGKMMRYSHEDVRFQKSHSFSNGPYVPFLRKKRNSTSDSRPASETNDRNSLRKITDSSPARVRKKSKVFADLEETARKCSVMSNRNSDSPRDSGVIINGEVKRDSNRYSEELVPSADYIVRRKNSRERDSYDSAYDSGAQGFRISFAKLNEDLQHPEECEEFNEELTKPEEVEKKHSASVNELFDTPSFRTPTQTPQRSRKISMPVLTRDQGEVVTRPRNVSYGPGCSPYTEDWPDWQIPTRESLMPSQETTL